MPAILPASARKSRPKATGDWLSPLQSQRPDPYECRPL
jgi:hypothetical protein